MSSSSPLSSPTSSVFSYSSVVDRIYKRHSSVHPNVAYLHHPSGVTVIVLREVPESEVVEVNFESHKKGGMNRAENVVVGKGKKGGLLLQRETRLCTIRCKDGREIVVRAGVRGTLAEVNDRLKTNPDLVRTAPENQGYIAIVTYGAGKRNCDDLMEELPAKRVALNSRKVESDVIEKKEASEVVETHIVTMETEAKEETIEQHSSISKNEST